MSPTIAPETAALAPDAAAKLLGISTRTLARLTAAGEITAMRIGRPSTITRNDQTFVRWPIVKYRREELERFMQQAAQPAPRSAS